MTPSDFPKPALRCSKCSCEWSRTVAATCPLCGASALPADPRPTLPAPAHHESRVIITADVLAGAVCRLVQAGTLDARSEVGDALLSYASTRHGDERPIDAVRETAEAIKLGANRLPASAVALPAEPDEDGLDADWSGEVVWCNPPYSDIASWAAKAWQESQRGATVVMLVPCASDRHWWADHVEGKATEIRLLTRSLLPSGRIHFERKDGTRGRAPFASALLIYRAAPDTREEPNG